MYIEFVPCDIPLFDEWLVVDLECWAIKYNVPYNTKRVKDQRRVTFRSDEMYSFFAVTWNPEWIPRKLNQWRLVLDLNNKTVFEPQDK